MAAPDSMRAMRSADRFTTVGDGVRTRHLLSFGDHYDPELTSLGPLVVHNDEVVEPGSGYLPHRHRGVEIVTWVVSGRLRHRDPNGEAVLGPGSAQLLSAGSGILHEEIAADDEDWADPSEGDPVTAVRPLGSTRFIQMWLASEDSSPPRHAWTAFDDAVLREGLVAIAVGPGASIDQAPEALKLTPNGVCCLVGRLASGVPRPLPDAPGGHLFVVHGAVTVGGSAGDVRLDAGDSALLDGLGEPHVVAVNDAEIVVWAWGS